MTDSGSFVKSGGMLSSPSSESRSPRARPRAPNRLKVQSDGKKLVQPSIVNRNPNIQLRQMMPPIPANRRAVVYALGKEFLLVLRYLPAGVLNRLNTYLPSQVSLSTDPPQIFPSRSLLSPSLNLDRSRVYSSTTQVVTNVSGKASSVGSAKVASMWNRVLSSNSSGSDESQNKSVVPKEEPSAPSKSLITSETPKKSSPIKVTTEKAVENDWSLDPDLKPFLQDMTAEWRNIQARTRYLVAKLNSIVDEDNMSKMQCLEDLYRHLDAYRESRSTAIECGTIKTLVKLAKNQNNSPCIINCARETLAVLGCNPAVKGHGIKILSIDGGGVRGLVAIEVLRLIEQRTGQKVHELFDYICGVSTGSILAFLIGAHRRTLGECESLYKQLSQEIFNQNSLIGAGNLFWSHSYYNTAAWEKILKKHIGEKDLLTLARDPDLPRVAAISTLVNQERVSPYVFRTYAFRPEVRSRYIGGSRYEMWEAVRASAAAPTYFEEIKLGNNLHQDGGVLVNNPTSVALSEAKSLWTGLPLQCVMSLGTGQTFSSRKNPNFSEMINPSNPKSPNSLSWKGKFLKVLDSATDTESVHHTLTELLPPNVYFRFNPHLSEMITMDEAKAEKLEQLQEETREYLTRNMEKVDYCCQMLTKPKGVVRKVHDWWSFYT